MHIKIVLLLSLFLKLAHLCAFTAKTQHCLISVFLQWHILYADHRSICLLILLNCTHSVSTVYHCDIAATGLSCVCEHENVMWFQSFTKRSCQKWVSLVYLAVQLKAMVVLVLHMFHMVCLLKNWKGLLLHFISGNLQPWDTFVLTVILLSVSENSRI